VAKQALELRLLKKVCRYRGELPELSGRRPTAEEMIDDDAAPRHMAGYLINRLADGVRTRMAGKQAELRLTFKD
jgi:hypothetical protein